MPLFRQLAPNPPLGPGPSGGAGVEHAAVEVPGDDVELVLPCFDLIFH